MSCNLPSLLHLLLVLPFPLPLLIFHLIISYLPSLHALHIFASYFISFYLASNPIPPPLFFIPKVLPPFAFSLSLSLLHSNPPPSRSPCLPLSPAFSYFQSVLLSSLPFSFNLSFQPLPLSTLLSPLPPLSLLPSSTNSLFFLTFKSLLFSILPRPPFLGRTLFSSSFVFSPPSVPFLGVFC